MWGTSGASRPAKWSTGSTLASRYGRSVEALISLLRRAKGEEGSNRRRRLPRERRIKRNVDESECLVNVTQSDVLRTPSAGREPGCTVAMMPLDWSDIDFASSNAASLARRCVLPLTAS